jgi:hypothetical protein
MSHSYFRITQTQTEDLHFEQIMASGKKNRASDDQPVSLKKLVASHIGATSPKHFGQNGRQDTKKSNRSQPRQQCNGPQTVTQRPQENWVDNGYKYILVV